VSDVLEIDFYANRRPDLATVGAMAADLESAGCGGLWSIEAGSDPLLPLALAAASTSRMVLGTAVAVALARNPVVLGQAAHDLNVLAGGRFVLGLGSQVKTHIVRRYGLEWSHPAARMREFVGALRAVWACWNDGAPLDFRGEFYRHTLMTPTFAPDPSPHGPPRVVLAGVGDIMTRLAGEVADGFACHPLTTPQYLTDVTLPALQRGRELSARDRSGFTVMAPVLVVTGSDAAATDAALAATRLQIGFYASTPAYRTVLESVGAGAVAPRLTELSKLGEWDEMGRLVSDDLVEAFAVVAHPKDLVAAIRERFDGLLDRAALYAPYDVADDVWHAVLESATNGRRADH